MRTRALLGYLFLSAAAAAAPLAFSSGPARVDLIELFTSEGCSSCPPADRWLGDLRDKAGLWKEFVPLEFHVNYWDSLGWKDRLSSRDFTDRQYAYATLWGSKAVYTPCFVRNGTEWRPLWGGLEAPQGEAGTLSVEISPDGTCRIGFSPDRANGGHVGPLEAHVALLGGGITSKVTAGENRGETLGHEFVVMGLADAPLEAKGAGLGAEVRLPRPLVPDLKRRALAAWVTQKGGLAPIQATGGWLR